MKPQIESLRLLSMRLFTFRYLFVTPLLTVLLPGVAVSQLGGGAGGSASPLMCSGFTASTPTLRSEGLTEALGDILIACFGGASAAAGQRVPQVNVTVFLPGPVSSELLNGQLSEALLLIDEPNAGYPGPVAGFGPALPFTLCGTPLSGCAAWSQQATDTGGNIYEVAVNSSTASATPGNAAPNVYQGVVGANQVTFRGVPILAPGDKGVRVLRITNIRVNARQVTPSVGFSPVQAAIQSSDPINFPLANPTPILGFAQPSLITSVTTSAATPGQPAACGTQPLRQGAILTYQELFASAFKTRVDPTVAGQASGQSAALVQNMSGTIYRSESDFTLAIPDSAPAGLANFGTRFKAVFRNIATGVRVFVSLTNVTVDPNTGLATGQASASSPSFAELVRYETGPFSVPTPDANTPDTNIRLVEITPSDENGTATAVWEVVNTTPFAIDTLQFGVFVSPNATHVAPSSATVNLSYAPTGGNTTASAVIPRFGIGQAAPVPLLQACPGNKSEHN